MNKEISQLPSIITLISQNRTELMGVATISVFFMHIFAASDISSMLWRDFLGIPGNWMFTEGFLFLSGFGIYFSLERESKVMLFYKKRLSRLYLPFLLIAGPFIIFLSLHRGDNIWLLLARLAAVNYWIEGNFAGMWYVSVTLVMYLLSPLLFKILKSKYYYISYTLIFLFLLGLLDYLKLYLFIKEEFSSFQWSLVQVPAFFIGMLVARMKDSNQNLICVLLLSTLLLEPIINTIIIAYNRLTYLPIMFQHLNYILIFAILFAYIKAVNRNLLFLGVFFFIGKHSLELYILHILLYCSLKEMWTISPLAIILISETISLVLCHPVKMATAKLCH